MMRDPGGSCRRGGGPVRAAMTTGTGLCGGMTARTGHAIRNATRTGCSASSASCPRAPAQRPIGSAVEPSARTEAVSSSSGAMVSAQQAADASLVPDTTRTRSLSTVWPRRVNSPYRARRSTVAVPV